MQIAFPDPPLAEGGVVLRRLEADDIGWITVACGDRIAQLVICPVAHAELRPVDALDATPRGAGGYGSTG